jgi:hypothetical protein
MGAQSFGQQSERAAWVRNRPVAQGLSQAISGGGQSSSQPLSSRQANQEVPGQAGSVGRQLFVNRDRWLFPGSEEPAPTTGAPWQSPSGELQRFLGA